MAEDTNPQNHRRDNAKFSIHRTVRNNVEIFKLHTHVKNTLVLHKIDFAAIEFGKNFRVTNLVNYVPIDVIL